MKKIDTDDSVYDVDVLLNYDAEDHPIYRSFTLCKTQILGFTFSKCEPSFYNVIYLLLVKDEKFPIFITNAFAREILSNPIKGCEFILERLSQRYNQ